MVCSDTGELKGKAEATVHAVTELEVPYMYAAVKWDH